ncbi:hypothetical protein ACWGB8_35820 [Kitasatospora sp. NPDC054939]
MNGASFPLCAAGYGSGLGVVDILLGILVLGGAWWLFATLPSSTSDHRIWDRCILGASVFFVLVAGVYGSQVEVPVGYNGTSPTLIYMLQIAAVVTPGAVAVLVRGSKVRTRSGTQTNLSDVRGNNRIMPISVEFFVAPGDGVAAEVGLRQRVHDYPALECAGFFPDDAVRRWEVLLTGGADSGLRAVVPMRNDGFTVFEVPEALCAALAQAHRGRLVEAAVAWAESAATKGEGVRVGTAVEILIEVADLAHTAEVLRQPLYCWYFAP